MRRLAVVAALVGALSACTPPPAAPAAVTSASHCVEVNGKADALCNPGATNPLVTQANLATTVCAPPVNGVKSWTQRQRPATSYTNALKAKQMIDYGETGPASDYEEDHIIPLSIGGNPTDPRNLVPELWNGATGAHVKDKEEVQLWHAVCHGEMSLATAQATIVRDWLYTP